MCHLLLALPIISLPIFYFLPFDMAAPIYSFLLFISFAVYYAAAKVMMKPVVSGMEAMIGAFAEVVDDLDPEGKIIYQNEIWDAYFKKGARKGELVRIAGFDGLRAVVEDRLDPSAIPGRSTFWGCKLHNRR